MIFVVWEHPANVIDSLYTYFYEKFPKSTRFYAGKDLGSSDVEMLSRPPLLRAGWLILCDSLVKPSALKQINEANPKNIILIRAHSKKDVEKIHEKYNGVEYKVLDNHILDKEKVITWIMSELLINKSNAEFLYKRANGNLNDIVIAVQNIKPLPDRNKSIISKFTVKNSRAYINDVVPFLLGAQNSFLDKKEIMQTIYKFRFAFSWMIKEIKKDIGVYAEVFNLISTHVLTVDNYMKVKNTVDSKAVRHLSDNKLRFIILLYGEVSYEHLLYVKSRIDCIGTGSFEIIKLIQLINIGG